MEEYNEKYKRTDVGGRIMEEQVLDTPELEKLVKEAQEGNQESFSKLYESIYKEMYKYAFYVLKSKEDAEDIVSDAVYEMYRNLKKLREPSKFRNWVFKILSNKCKKKLGTYAKAKIVEMPEEIAVHQEQLEEKEDLKQAYMGLEEEERCIVSMAVFGGYKSYEIGEILQMPAGTVRSKLSRALGKLQKKLEVYI